MPIVDFKFGLGTVVETRAGLKGPITSLILSADGIYYRVETRFGGSIQKESHLRLAPAHVAMETK